MVYVFLFACVCVARAVAHVCKYVLSVASAETSAASESRQNNLAQHGVYVIYGKLLLMYMCVCVCVGVGVSAYNDYYYGMCIVCTCGREEIDRGYKFTLIAPLSALLTQLAS